MDIYGCDPTGVTCSEGAGKLARLPIEYDSEFDTFSLMRNSTYRIALLVPLCGSAGLWSPSCIASAQVAVEELNQRSGINGRQVQLVMIDSAFEAPVPVEEVVNDLIEAKAIDAIVGMHISAIRQRLSKIVRQRIPYIYTPLYEGGESTPGIFSIGETPGLQLGPAMDFLNCKYAMRRWALIGNDYVWPHVSHSFAKQKIKELDATLVYERYLPFGLDDMQRFIGEIEQSNADAVLISLVGHDAVLFNRSFGEAGLHRKAVRLSCAIEENALLACGSQGLNRLFSSASYFGALQTDANAAFREKYYGMHGDSAPLLNAVGQSTYEGVQFLGSLIERYSDEWRSLDCRRMPPVAHASARWQNKAEINPSLMPIYVARANGIQFDIIKRI